LRRYRLWTSAVFGALLALLVVGSATPAVKVRVYTASITPTSLVAGTTAQPFTLTITNSATSNRSLGSANVTVPSGFSSVSLGSITASGGLSWTGGLSGGLIQLRATNTGNSIGPGQAVSVGLTANGPTVTGTYTWATAADESVGFSGTGPFSLSGSDPTVTITPGPLDHFSVGPISPAGPKAGDPASVTGTAYDQFNNIKTDYVGGATLSGDLSASAKGCPFSPNPPQCSPLYGSFPTTWPAGGVASASLTAYKAEGGVHVTVADGTKTGTSDPFQVVPGDPYRLSFDPADGGQQPVDTKCSKTSVCPTSNAGSTVILVKVYDEDQFGNPEVGKNVKISIGNNAGTPAGTLGGTKVKAAASDGIATFGATENLNIDNVGLGYTLKAESPDVSPTANTTSNSFNVANTVKTCSGANCTATASNTNTSVTASADVNGLLSITLQTQPAGTCSAITKPTGEILTVNPTGTTNGDLLVDGTFFHQNNAGGIGNYVLCKNSGPGTPFHQVFACGPKQDPPCYTKLSGNGQGDVSFQLIAKRNPDGTYDPGVTGGGH
jgi:hypothetical protein